MKKQQLVDKALIATYLSSFHQNNFLQDSCYNFAIKAQMFI